MFPLSPTTLGSPLSPTFSPYSPLRKYANLTVNTSPKTSMINDHDIVLEGLVTRHPILNGYTNTVGDLENNDVDRKSKELMDFVSPTLKKSLEKRTKEFTLKLSSTKIDEEKKIDIIKEMSSRPNKK